MPDPSPAPTALTIEAMVRDVLFRANPDPDSAARGMIEVLASEIGRIKDPIQRGALLSAMHNRLRHAVDHLPVMPNHRAGQPPKATSP